MMGFARRAMSALLLFGLATVAGAAQSGARAGSMETITVHGASLAGNLSGDAADRKVKVYLPPGYATERRKRYPVIYFLHGFGIVGAQMLGKRFDFGIHFFDTFKYFGE